MASEKPRKDLSGSEERPLLQMTQISAGLAHVRGQMPARCESCSSPGLAIHLQGNLSMSGTSRYNLGQVHSPYVCLLVYHLPQGTDLSDIAFDPYSYSRGRWLDQNEQRQKARRLDFNFDALLDVAAKCSPGARKAVACERREGGFNRVSIVELDNGAKIVAKVPMGYAGPAALTTMSEVATLKYGIRCFKCFQGDHELTCHATKSRARHMCLSLRSSRGARNPRAVA